jgi:hypothetical protein
MDNKGTDLDDGAEKGFVSRKLVLFFVRSFLLNTSLEVLIPWPLRQCEHL